MIKIYCSKCGMTHEVSKSHTNAYMFCLGCDQFFKIDKKIKAPKKEVHSSTTPKPSLEERAEAAKAARAASKKKKRLATAMQKIQIREILSFVMQKKPSKETLSSVMKIMRSRQILSFMMQKTPSKKTLSSLLQMMKSKETAQELKRKLRMVFRKFFIFKTSESEPDSDLTLLKKIRDAPKLDEDTLLPAPEPFALMDNFLKPGADFESQLEEESPAEYIEFLSAGLDAFSTDFFDNYGKEKPVKQTSKVKKK